MSSENIIFFHNYLIIALFFIIAFFLAFVVMALPNILTTKIYNKSKLESYECGFQPFGHGRNKFEIKFYLVALLFIIFDLEITFLIPWSISLNSIGKFGFFSMMFFLFILFVAFIYEWRVGALEWE